MVSSDLFREDSLDDLRDRPIVLNSSGSKHGFFRTGVMMAAFCDRGR